jgi:tetratricopeptide (TPR) repeat protein
MFIYASITGRPFIARLQMPDEIPVTADHKITKVILRPGFGRLPKDGEKVCLRHEGRLKSTGAVFDSAEKNGHKFKFELGKDEVIDGLTAAVSSMTLGERSVFTIHPDYGYGEKGRDQVIPPNSWLEFDIELADIREKFFNAIEADKRAVQIKDEAAVDFKAGRFEDCIRKYRSAWHVVNDWVNEDSMKLRVVLARNLAICYAKVGNWKKCLKNAEYVIGKEPGDPRALLKKAEALVETGRFDDAQGVLTIGLTITGNSAPFVEVKKRMMELQRSDQARQNEVFAQMFKK